MERVLKYIHLSLAPCAFAPSLFTLLVGACEGVHERVADLALAVGAGLEGRALALLRGTRARAVEAERVAELLRVLEGLSELGRGMVRQIKP